MVNGFTPRHRAVAAAEVGRSPACLDGDDHNAYAVGLHRVLSPLHTVPESAIRETLANNGWRVDYLGPTTNVANIAGYDRGWDDLSEHVRARCTPEVLEQIRDLNRRQIGLADLVNDQRVSRPSPRQAPCVGPV